MSRITEADILIGKRIMQARKQKKTGRVILAGQMGFSHQQLAKYESGKDRVSAGKIPLFAEKLNKPIMFFYGEEPQEPEPLQALN